MVYLFATASSDGVRKYRLWVMTDYYSAAFDVLVMKVPVFLYTEDYGEVGRKNCCGSSLKHNEGTENYEGNGKNANEFARVGRSRWRIENECFNIQKNIRYDIEHANSQDYDGMKCHYLLTQIADILLQLYETGNLGIKKDEKIYLRICRKVLASYSQRKIYFS